MDASTDARAAAADAAPTGATTVTVHVPDGRGASPTRSPLGERAAERPAAPAGAPRWLWLTALLGVAGVQTALSLDAVAPVQTKDEIGYLMAGRLLGGGGGADLIMPPHAGGYSAGWGLLASPLWGAAGGDPVRFLHLTIALNVALATVAVCAWAAVSRRLGAGSRTAVVVGAVVAVAPGRALYTGYALPEALIGLLVAVAFLLVLRLWDGRAAPAGARSGTAVSVALLAGYLGLVHSRFVPTAALLVVVLAWWTWRSRRRGGWLVVALGAGGVAASVVVNRLVEARLYGEVDRFSAAGDQIGQLHGGFMASLVVGHAWYGAVAWGGLTVVGGLWAARHARSELRRRAPGPWTVLLVMSLGQLVVGAVYLSTRLTVGAGRLDQVVYGRYTDPVWALLAAVGLTVVVTGRLDRPLWRRTVQVVGLLSVGAVVVLFAVGGIVRGLVQLNVPGIGMWEWTSGGELAVPVAQASLAALAGLLGLRWLQARGLARAASAGVVLAVAAVLALAGTFAAEHRTIAPRDAYLRELFTLRETVEDYPAARVVLVVDRPLLLTGTAFQYWLGDRDYRLVDPAQEATKIQPGELVIGTLWPRPLMIGAPTRLVQVDPGARYGVWYAPVAVSDPLTR